MPITTNNQNLIEEKNKLLIKLDNNSNYNSPEDIKVDEERVGELELEILEKTKLCLEELYAEIPKIEKEFKIEKIKDLRAIRNIKYEKYCEITKLLRNLTDQLVEKKKEGRELAERLRESNKDKFDINETVTLIRRY